MKQEELLLAYQGFAPGNSIPKAQLRAELQSLQSTIDNQE